MTSTEGSETSQGVSHFIVGVGTTGCGINKREDLGPGDTVTPNTWDITCPECHSKVHKFGTPGIVQGPPPEGTDDSEAVPEGASAATSEAAPERRAASD